MHLIDATQFCLVSFTVCHVLGTVLGVPVADYQYSEDQEDYDYDKNYDANDYPEKEQEVYNPKMLSKPLKLAVAEGTTINLPCHVDKLGGNIVLWYKDSVATTIAMGDSIVNNEMRKDKRATVTSVENGTDAGSVLLIGVATPEDEGTYVCQIQNEKMTEVKHYVTIVTPPTVEISSPGDGDVISSTSQTILNAKKGDDVTLTCTGEGTPEPTITWTRMGKKMPDGSPSRSETEIMYTKVTRKHEGTYKCTASNGGGSDAYKTIKVVVEYEPEIEVQEVFIHSQTGDAVELVCNVHAVPRPEVVWSKDGVKINDDNHANIEIKNMQHKHTLSIDGVKEDDYGIYHCEATNTLGSSKKQLEISGNAKAAKFSSDASGREETTYLLEWSAMSYTPITEFMLEYREEGGTWTPISVKPNTNEQHAYHKYGKHPFNDLQLASNYQARVKSKNGQGWSKPSPVFNFATKGAAPRSDRVTDKSSGCSLYSSLATVIFAMILSTSLRQN